MTNINDTGNFFEEDTTTDRAGYVSGTPYDGPVAGIQTELDLAHGAIAQDHVGPNGDPVDGSFNILSFTPDVFIVTGQSNDSIDVSQGGGNNILDGGGGSNFLTGGGGNDTFYVDARNPTANVWSTLKDFHDGDSATIWGVTPADFTLTWLDGQGAAGQGNQGLTAVFTAPGVPEVGVTFASWGSGALATGGLTVSYGRTADMPGLPGSNYMHVASE